MFIKKLKKNNLILIMICCITAQAYGSARVLNIHDLELQPNPFSPHSTYYNAADDGQGMRISFKVETLSKLFWLNLKVYNMQGNIVRTIAEREVKLTDAGDKHDKAKTVVWWDGKNDAGQYAKNGRYLVHIRISDTEAEAVTDEKLKPVVLIK